MNIIKLSTGKYVVLNWVPSFKPSHYGFISKADNREVADCYYKNGKSLNQEDTPACAGFGSAHICDHYFPSDNRISNDLALDFYYAAQKEDNIPGEAYDGTTSDGVMKVLRRDGWITEYKWHLTFSDFLISLCNDGPVGAGLPWFTGMLEPDNDGYIHATGDYVGGHFVEIVGYDVERTCFRIHNSWGEDWGVLGADCLISIEDMELIWGNGETVIPTAATLPPEEKEVIEEEKSFWDWFKSIFNW